MDPELTTHALLRIAAPADLLSEAVPPAWVSVALQRAPWVVVRRAAARGGLIPVGVRGASRSERFAAYLPRAAPLERLSPLELAARRGWRHHPRRGQVAALAALDEVQAAMERAHLGRHWGPAGSLGFELASGCPTTTPQSDADLVVWLGAALSRRVARALLAELQQLPVRADVLLETPLGAVALAEYAGARAPWLLRTATGARRVGDPWGAAVAV